MFNVSHHSCLETSHLKLVNNPKIHMETLTQIFNKKSKMRSISLLDMVLQSCSNQNSMVFSYCLSQWNLSQRIYCIWCGMNIYMNQWNRMEIPNYRVVSTDHQPAVKLMMMCLYRRAVNQHMLPWKLHVCIKEVIKDLSHTAYKNLTTKIYWQVAFQVWALTFKPDEMSSSSGTHMVEGES